MSTLTGVGSLRERRQWSKVVAQMQATQAAAAAIVAGTFSNIDAGASGTAGTVDIYPVTASKGKATLACANQDGNTAVTITVQGMGQATAVKLPDPGTSTSYLMQMSSESDRVIVGSTPAQIDAAVGGAFTDIDAGSSGVAGSVDVFPATGSKGKVALTCANQDGNTTVTLNVLGMGQATTVKLPDPGVATSYLMQMGAESDRVIVDATPSEINNACDVSGRTQTLTATGAVTAGVQCLLLNHTSVAIAATVADAAAHQGLFIAKATTEPGGGADHTVTLTSGTWNGTNTVATFADINDALVVYFDSAGNGTVLANVGTVALSGP